MSDRLFRLMERHQKLDELLRRAQARRFVDPTKIVRLTWLKLTLRNRLARLYHRQAA